VVGIDLTFFYYLSLCSHFIVPELGPTTKFSYASHKAVSEYKEAKAVCSWNHITVSATCNFAL
jgi:hypothetical protein